VLGRFGNEFEVVGYSTDIDHAIDEIMSINPVLVIFNIDMPPFQMNGYQVMRKVADKGIECRFIALSDTWTTETMRDFFHSGGFDYLLKPLSNKANEAVFLDTLKNFITKQKAFQLEKQG